MFPARFIDVQWGMWIVSRALRTESFRSSPPRLPARSLRFPRTHPRLRLLADTGRCPQDVEMVESLDRGGRIPSEEGTLMRRFPSPVPPPLRLSAQARRQSQSKDLGEVERNRTMRAKHCSKMWVKRSRKMEAQNLGDVEWNPASGTSDPGHGAPLGDLAVTQKNDGLPSEREGDPTASSAVAPKLPADRM